MNKQLVSILLVFFMVSCSSIQEESVDVAVEAVVEEALPTDSTTSTSTTTSTTTTTPEVNVDEYGVEILDISDEMKQQLSDLAAFVANKVGISYIEEPKFSSIH